MLIPYISIANFSVSEEQLKDARDTLCDILSSPAGTPGAFYVLRFLTRHETLRRRFIAHDEVIGALIRALEWTAKSPNENLFPLVMDSLRYLINEGASDQCPLGAYSSFTDDRRDSIINLLSASSGESQTMQSRLSMALEVKGNGVSLAMYFADLHLHST